ncbi:isochorismatase family protein [Paenibacillus sp. LMG 31456]|uniref:Isochorismatase family protein n=1 Tax=Paenibacillus foliorum TaxID=2654974 RepID=A0A972GTM8_9BACL|nr:cysteine hydrolase family protein [Paenibacillus foliorum]NOU93632.1 isochorismatase family protein [Paenibacillus foliorum]
MSSNTALLIIDVQNAMFIESDPVFQGEALLNKIQNLISKARVRNIPIFYVQHHEGQGQPLEQGKPGWLIHPSIEPHPIDSIIQKNTPDSFYQTTLQQELTNKEINEVIIAGIQSEICVDTTCRRAFSLGYKVTLVQDAHSTWNTQYLTASQIIQHHNSVLRWFSTVKNTEDIIF